MGPLIRLRSRLRRVLARPASIRAHVIVPLRRSDGSEVDGHIYSFHGLVDGREHLAIGIGPFDSVETPLVRLHSECMTGDVFGSARCDCGGQLDEAIDRIGARGGYLLYLRQEGRGIGLYNKLDAYRLQDAGLDTYEANVALGFHADERDYAPAAQMLQALGHERVLLLTNNPDKHEQLEQLGIEVRAAQSTGVFTTSSNARYLQTKVDATGHHIELARLLHGA